MNSNRKQVLYFLFFSWLLFNLFYGNNWISLWDEDEAAYAGFGMRILETGDWLVPEFTWSEVHRKTPLHFWSVAISYKIFGVNEFGVRFPGVLAVLLTLFSMWTLGARIFDQSIARLSVLILGSSLFVPNLAKIGITDPELLLWQTLSVLLLFYYIKFKKFKWWFWLAIAGGVLVKGPPIIILTGGICGFLFLFKTYRKPLLSTYPWFGIPLALLPLFIWGYFAWQRDGGVFISWLWDWYTFKRIDGEVFGQTGPPGYHLAILMGSYLPWIAFIPVALYRVIRQTRTANDTDRFLQGWLLFGWVFYELMTSKLPAYSLGAQPAFAILIAKEIQLFFKSDYKYTSAIRLTASLQFLLTMVAAVAMILAFAKYFQRPGMNRAILAATAWWVSAGVLIVLILQRNNYKALVGACTASGLVLTSVVWLLLMPMVENSPIKSTKQVAQLVAANKTRTTISLPNKRHRKVSLPFYLEQNGVIYNHEGSYKKAINNYLKQPDHQVICSKKVIDYLYSQTDSSSIQPYITKIDWQSSDDKLKSHPYFILNAQ